MVPADRAVRHRHVVAWQWCGGETTAAWQALFEQIPEPGVVVTDGGSGIRSALTAIDSIDDAITWRLTLEAWWQRYGHLTRERTMYDNGQFGFTHLRLRKAWSILHRAAEAGHVFTYLEHGNPRTTSPLEGGINAQIRYLLRHHRGMSIEHRRRAVEWHLLLHEIPIDRAHRYADPPEPPQPIPTSDEPLGPARYDTGLDAGEGLWLRTGWAGRG